MHITALAFLRTTNIIEVYECVTCYCSFIYNDKFKCKERSKSKQGKSPIQRASSNVHVII